MQPKTAIVRAVVQDGWTSSRLGIPLTEPVFLRSRGFSAGPKSDRLEVWDERGPVPHQVGLYPRRVGKPALYRFRVPKNPSRRYNGLATSKSFMYVATFAAAQWTLQVCEGPWALGRKVRWSDTHTVLRLYPRPKQLSKEPEEGLNAEYLPPSSPTPGLLPPKISFFGYRPPRAPIPTYSCLCRDAVSHEMGHAILYGIHPQIHVPKNLDTLSLDEAFADMMALVMALESRKLRRALAKKGGNLLRPNALNRIAEEIGVQEPNGKQQRAQALRVLTLVKRDKMPEPGEIDSEDEFGIFKYDYSVLLSGAVYRFFVDLYLHATKEAWGAGTVRSRGRALMAAARRLKQDILRAAEFLPPVYNLTFADFGRALFVADALAYPMTRGRWVQQSLRKHLASNGIRGAVPLSRRVALGRPGGRLSADAMSRILDRQFTRGVSRELGLPRHIRKWGSARDLYDTITGFVTVEEPRPVVVGRRGNPRRRELVIRAAWLEPPAPNGRDPPMSGRTVVVDVESRRILAVLSVEGSRRARGMRGFARLVDRYGLAAVTRCGLGRKLASRIKRAAKPRASRRKRRSTAARRKRGVRAG